MCLIVAALAELWWFARGQVLLDSAEIVRFAVFGFITTILAAVLLWGPRERRLDLLLLGLLAGSWLGAMVDYFFWMMIYASHDTPPGAGWAQTAAYVGAGAGIIYLTLADTSARHGRDDR